MGNTKKIMCGNVQIGGGAPISIQSMTNTDTRNPAATLEQIYKLEEAGCEIIRCAVPDTEAALAIEKIKTGAHIPVVADIHFDYRLAVAAIESGADKVRINPGNIGNDDKLLLVVEAAKKRGIPIRVGVNSGSLERNLLEKYGGVAAEGLVESVLNNVKRIENMGYDNIVISIKASDVRLNYEAHRLLGEKTQYPLHIGITESGTVSRGKTKSAVGLGALILSGIGDTMRVSLTGDPVREVTYAREILAACGVRSWGVNLVSCPTCGRTRVNLEEIALDVENRLAGLEKKFAASNKSITVAVMGCEVNGPGEAREADFGLAFGKDKAALFKNGQIIKTVPASEAVEALIEEIND